MRLNLISINGCPPKKTHIKITTLIKYIKKNSHWSHFNLCNICVYVYVYVQTFSNLICVGHLQDCKNLKK